ncbi:hypothetical protein FRC11_000089 [Ceratobasidium sp. 423]|nr:hypothetical protein FRC11_000089 [Ceratobasidium sp. 423]
MHHLYLDNLNVDDQLDDKPLGPDNEDGNYAEEDEVYINGLNQLVLDAKGKPEVHDDVDDANNNNDEGNGAEEGPNDDGIGGADSEGELEVDDDGDLNVGLE